MEIEEKTVEKPKISALVVGVTATAIAAVAYIGVCSYAHASNKILSNVEIENIAVGNMTKAEALTLVATQLTERLQTTPITLCIGTWTGELSGDIVQGEAEEAVDSAFSVGRTNFLTSGMVYLSNLTGGGAVVSVPLSFNPEGQEQLTYLLDQADATIGNGVEQSTWELDLEAQVLRVNKGISGTAVDRAAAEEATLVAIANGEISVVQLVTVTAEPNALDFAQLYHDIYTPAKSAEIDPITKEIIPHAVGVDIDVLQANTLYQSSAEGSTFTIPLKISQPEQTAEDIRGYLFADVLADVSTRVSGDTARHTNVRLAAEICNDIILMPGEVFSFYEAQQNRPDLVRGYMAGPAFVGGKTVDVTGGGICQVSSTIYYAVMHTKLQVVARSNHGYAIDYLPLAMDATYFDKNLDFKFQNSSEYPIKLVTSYYTGSNGSKYLSVQIMGTKTEEFTVKLESYATDYTKQDPEYVEDASVPIGTTVQEQSAVTGMTATLYRSYYDADGNLIEKVKEYTDVYRSRAAVIHYNPADAVSLGLAEPSPEPTPEVAPEVAPEVEVTPAPEAEPTPEVTPETNPEPEVAPEVTEPDSSDQSDIPVIEEKPSDSGIVIS